MKNFFISYNQADLIWAEWIAWQLEDAGYSTIIQAWDFRPGSNFVEEMQRALLNAERVIAVISPDYLSSEYAGAEWDAAFAEDPLGINGKLLPIKVKECRLEGLKRTIININLIGLDGTVAREKLIKGISKERAKPAKEPVFPISTLRPQFPGSLPDVWNVPDRNPNFSGREQIIADLRVALASSQLGAWRQALWGLGGIGKTQIAIEYAYRYVADYSKVGWLVRSEEFMVLASDYAALAGKLGLPESNSQDQTIIVNSVRHWLEHNSDWLLIFDNAVRPEDIIGYLPRGGNGHIIITSRNPNWESIGGVIPIRIFDRAESIQFLHKRTKKCGETGDLADVLGDLPLALEQASAYIVEAGISLADYLERFKKYHFKLLEYGKPINYNDTIATTWEISFRAVQEKSKASADLLNLCAFLAPENIPRSLLINGIKILPEPLASGIDDEFDFDNIIKILKDYSLINTTSTNLSVHRLVQIITRNRLEADNQRRWSQVAITLLDNSFIYDSNRMQTWKECSVLLPHTLAASSYAEDFNVALEVTSHLLNEVGLYLKKYARFTEAKSVLERAIRIEENIHSPNHPSIAIRASNIGLVLYELGDFEKAKIYFEKALKIGEKEYGSDHPKVAIYHNNLGLALRKLNDYDGAKNCFERAIMADAKATAFNPHDVVAHIVNFGMALQDLGNPAEAVKFFARALEIGEKFYEPSNPELAPCLSNLGTALADAGDLDKALEYVGRALEVSEKAYGLNHPDVAVYLTNLIVILNEAANLDANVAEDRLKLALRICQELLGDNHPTTRDIRENIRRIRL